MGEEKKYRQLAMFTTIVAEVVITPSIIGGGIYWLLRGKESQTIWVGVGAVAGLVVAIYRIYLLNRAWSKNSDE